MSYNGRESGSINGRQPPLGQYVETAGTVIFKENGVVKAKDGLDGSIIATGDYINEVVNALSDPGLIYIKQGTYLVTAPMKNVKYVKGSYNAETHLKLADGANCNVFEITDHSWVWQYYNLRITGNMDNNTSGTGLYNAKGEEVNILNCEFRNFQDYGVDFTQDGVSNTGWNNIIHCWFLNNHDNGLHLDTINDGAIWNFMVKDSLFTGETMEVAEGIDLTGLHIGNNTFFKSDPKLLLKGGSPIFIGNNQFFDQRDTYCIRFPALGSSHTFNAVITGNQLKGDTDATGIGIGSNCDGIHVHGNKFNIGTPLDIASGANPNGTVRHNIPRLERRLKYPTHPYGKDLIGYWPFEDGNDPTEDWSGNLNEGDLVNDPTWVGGRLGQALDFDGSDDHIDVGASDVFGVSSFTVCFWFRADAIETTGDGDQTMVNFAKRSGPDFLIGSQSYDTALGITIHDDSNGPHKSEWGLGNISNDKWYFVCVTRDASADEIKLYVNGDLKDTNTDSFSYTPSAAGFYIGYRGDGVNYFDGTIDEVRYYSRVLSKGEIRQLYRKGIGTGGLREDVSTGNIEIPNGNLLMGGNSIQDVIEQNLNGRGSAPSSPSTGDIVLASPTWDPDGDGNGEVVIYDGTAWQEMADMPNYT